MKLIKFLFLLAFLGSSLNVYATQNLAVKHGAVWPKSQNGFVTKQQCMRCHGSYAELAKKTASLNVNPHRSHLGEVDCVQCHKPTQAKPELMCNSCHKFKLEKK